MLSEINELLFKKLRNLPTLDQVSISLKPEEPYENTILTAFGAFVTGIFFSAGMLRYIICYNRLSNDYLLILIV